MADDDTMLYVGGSKTAFRCHCGANVFHRVKEITNKKTYECNGCGDWYTDGDSYIDQEESEQCESFAEQNF